MGGFLNVANTEESFTYMPLNGFTTVDLGCERGNNAYTLINRLETPFSEQYAKIFQEIWDDKSKVRDVTEEVMRKIALMKPLRAVFRDDSFEDNLGKLNIEGIFKSLSQNTTVRVI